MAPDAVPPLAARAAAGGDLLVVEGVMGLFDGASDGTVSSTADVAQLLQAPVLLVVDASAMSDSVAAVVHGYATLRPDVPIAGVVLNQVGSPTHATMLREALAPSASPCSAPCHATTASGGGTATWVWSRWRSSPQVVRGSLQRLADIIRTHVDLERRGGPGPLGPRAADRTRCRCPDPGRRSGWRSPAAPPSRSPIPTRWTPSRRPAPRSSRSTRCSQGRLPAGIDGLLIGGGFPEVHGAALAANRPAAGRDPPPGPGRGLPTWAECGGLLLLAESLDGHPMAGVVGGQAVMTERLTLGYRQAVTAAAVAHRSGRYALPGPRVPLLDALDLRARPCCSAADGVTRTDGWATPTLLATYLHHHPGGDPGAIAAFASTCALRRTLRPA